MLYCACSCIILYDHQLLKAVGVRTTLKLMTVMPGLLMLCVFLWRPIRSARHTELDHYLKMDRRATIVDHLQGWHKYLSKFLNIRIFRKRNYVIWSAGVTVACLGYVVPYVHLVSWSSRIDGFLNVGSFPVICGVDTIKGKML